MHTFAELVAIDSPSYGEKQVSDYVRNIFKELNIEFIEDDAGIKLNASAGNLYTYVKGENGNPLLLSAHMDTVMPGIGKKAIIHEDGTITGNGNTVLGADDMAGITTIYEAIRYIKEQKLPHRDIELLFTVGEELYCKGAKKFDFSKVKSKAAYVLDLSGDVGKAAYAAPTILSFEIAVKGKTAHAGFAPENGINALKIAANAIANVEQGRIDEETTSNIGICNCGDGINIVPGECILKGEIRSLNHEKATRLARKYKEVFEEAAAKAGGSVIWNENVDVKAYSTPLESRSVKDYEKAVKNTFNGNREAVFEKTLGGSDNNVFAQNNIYGLVVATAMNKVHGTEEYTRASDLVKVTEILINLITG